jgi:hypothetical protein
MTHVQASALPLSPVELAVFDRRRRIGAERLDRRDVMEIDGSRYLVSADEPLKFYLSVLTLHHVNDDDTMTDCRPLSMVVLEVREDAIPFDAPDSWGLFMKALQRGAIFKHPTNPREPTYHVLPANFCPPKSMQLKGKVAKHLRKRDD